MLTALEQNFDREHGLGLGMPLSVGGRGLY